jgi:hypothetical protein
VKRIIEVARPLNQTLKQFIGALSLLLPALNLPAGGIVRATGVLIALLN